MYGNRIHGTSGFVQVGRYVPEQSVVLVGLVGLVWGAGPSQTVSIAIAVLLPVGQFDPQPLTFPRVGHETLTVAFPVWAMAHVYLAGLVVLAVVEFGVARSERFAVEVLAEVLLRPVFVGAGGLVGGFDFLRAVASLAGAPGGAEAEDLLVGNYPPSPGLQVVLDVGVEVSAQPAQLALERSRNCHLEEALAVPKELHSVLETDLHDVACFFYSELLLHLVGRRHAMAVELDSSLLLEVDADVAVLEGYPFRRRRRDFVCVGHFY